MPHPSFKSIQVDKGTVWGRLHQTLSQLGKNTQLPGAVDLRSKFHNAGIEVYNQGNLNSCTANAICAIWRYVQARIDKGFSPSRLFVYYNERLVEGTADKDSGAFISDGCRSLTTYGVCSEPTWAYKPEDEPVQPPQHAYDEARRHLIHTPAQISNNNIDDLKDSLTQDKPFVVGIAVYAEFMGDNVKRTGVVPMPGPKSLLHGYHAVTCVGYDDHKQHWIFRNSWGADWGDHGHFYLPYEYLAVEDNLASDFWNLTTDPNED
jgi:C1A family cysteine protease